jgi:hypothetical protein
MLVLVVSLELLVEKRSLVVENSRLVVAHLELDLVGLVLVEVDQELLLFEVVALAGQVVVGYCMELEVVGQVGVVELVLVAAIELVG